MSDFAHNRISSTEPQWEASSGLKLELELAQKHLHTTGGRYSYPLWTYLSCLYQLLPHAFAYV